MQELGSPIGNSSLPPLTLLPSAEENQSGNFWEGRGEPRRSTTFAGTHPTQHTPFAMNHTIPPKKQTPTYREIIQQIVNEADGPISRGALVEHILATRMPTAKNPRAAALHHIREEKGRSLVFLDAETVLPIRLAFHGSRFRIPVTAPMAKKGEIPLDPFLSFYFRDPPETVALLDRNGRSIPATIEERTETRQDPLFGEYRTPEQFAQVKDWMKSRKVRKRDHLLITIHDWERATFRIEVEPAKKRQHQLLKQRNQLLADIFYDLLEHERDERLWIRAGVPTAYALLPDKDGYPPDHWETVIQNDPRMLLTITAIQYSDAAPTYFERLWMELAEETTTAPPPRISKEQGKQVYRFKATLTHHKRTWRMIEILGKQTLADFNSILMQAFNRDWDHMGGFWKLVQRGGPKSKRFREVEIGTVNPLGEGDNADMPIAGIGLTVGDQIKYVYDFGDWIEHGLTLESIDDPQPGVQYPRVAAKNKPRYWYCQSCKKAGKRTVATWVCWTCTDETGKTVRVCDDCLDAHHETHYANEILY